MIRLAKRFNSRSRSQPVRAFHGDASHPAAKETPFGRHARNEFSLPLHDLVVHQHLFPCTVCPDPKKVNAGHRLRRNQHAKPTCSKALVTSGRPIESAAFLLWPGEVSAQTGDGWIAFAYSAQWSRLNSSKKTFPTKVPVERTPSSVRAKFLMTLTNGRRRPFYGFGPSRLLSETSLWDSACERLPCRKFLAMTPKLSLPWSGRRVKSAWCRIRRWSRSESLWKNEAVVDHTSKMSEFV